MNYMALCNDMHNNVVEADNNTLPLKNASTPDEYIRSS